MKFNSEDFYDGAVTTEKIADFAVDYAKIAHAAIGEVHIREASINSAAIQDLAVGRAKIALAAIGEAQIEDAAITSAKIQDASITNAKIANAAIDSAKIADAAITSAKIENAAILSAHIADSQIDRTKIIDGEITNAKIANGAIDSAKIQDAAIGTAHIQTGAITTALIGDSAIGTAQIADGSITDAKIVELTANKITAGTLDVERLRIVGPESILYEINVNNVGELTASEYTLDGGAITERSITADRIVAESITAREIASKTITANEIAANTITAGSGIIADAAITTAHIADAAITNAKIDNIDASKIKTGILDAERVRIGANTTFDAGYDPTKIEIGGRNLITKSSVSMSVATVNGYVYTLTKTSSSGNPYVRIPHTLFENDTEYVITFKARKISGNVYRLAGHSTLARHATVRLFIDGVEQTHKLSNGWSNVGTANFPNDNEVHRYEIRFKTVSDVASVSTPYWYIQPNRPQYDSDSFVLEIWDWQLEKGNKATDWRPAYEDNPALLWRYQDTTYIDGGNIYTGTITANKLNVNEIFSNSAVINKIRSDIIQTTELNAEQITTGILKSIELEGTVIRGSEIVGSTLKTEGQVNTVTIDSEGRFITENDFTNTKTEIYDQGIMVTTSAMDRGTQIQKNRVHFFGMQGGGVTHAEIRYIPEDDDLLIENAMNDIVIDSWFDDVKIKGDKIYLDANNISISHLGNALWTGERYPTDAQAQTVYPSKPLSDCMTGWILRWQTYTPGTGTSESNFQYTIVPKVHANFKNGYGIRVSLGFSPSNQNVVNKYIYVYNDRIVGHSDNNQYGNQNRVLTGVFEF